MKTATEGRRLRLLTLALVLGALVTIAAGNSAVAEQSESLERSYQAGTLSAGNAFACVALDDGSVRCWGNGTFGKLGYGNTNSIGDNETPDSAGPVDLGPGRSAKSISAGGSHTCAVLDNGSVRCWGSGANGVLGYGNTGNIGDDESPAAAGPVNLGAGRTAVSVTAGAFHTCALLDNGTVRCWGAGNNGRLGYGNTNNIGDDETPGSVGPVNLGTGRTAMAVSAGSAHTCALLDNGSIRCWGAGSSGILGYGNTNDIGDDESPGSAGPVDLGPGKAAVAISAADNHTCALLEDERVSCWGLGGSGRLGYGNTDNIGDDGTPGSAGTVDLGPDRTAVAVSAGSSHTCVLLDNGAVRCWGSGNNGRLGYGNTTTIGDDETPGSVGTVNLGTSRTAVAISAGDSFVCAGLDNGTVRCWGLGTNGRLGYGNTFSVGDDETPGSVGPVSIGGTLVADVADLSQTVSASVSRVDVGSGFAVRFDLSNSGPDTAVGVVNEIGIPAGVTPGSSFPSRGNFNPGSGIWNVGSLLPGQTASLRVSMTANSAGSLLFEADASSGVFDPVSINDGSEVEVTAGSLAGPTGPTGIGATGPTGAGPTGATGPVGPSRLGVALASKKLTGRAKKRLTVSYAATEPASVTARVLKGKKTSARASGRARQGANAIKVKLPKKPGSYRLELVARAGSVSANSTAKLVVRK